MRIVVQVRRVSDPTPLDKTFDHLAMVDIVIPDETSDMQMRIIESAVKGTMWDLMYTWGL